MGERRHIALVGFMGAGKSTVGKLLGERLGAPFVDLDEMIVKKAQKSIAELFRDHGEVGFRAHERAALREALERDLPVILATGGGTFVDPSMRAWVQKNARTVYLKATAESLMARIGTGEEKKRRPLLSGPDPFSTIRRLLADRSATYELCDVTVTTDEAGAEAVVEEIVLQLKNPRPAPAAAPLVITKKAPAKVEEPEIERPTFAPDGSGFLRVSAWRGDYPVELKPGAGEWLAEAVIAVCRGPRVAVVTDTSVGALHGKALVTSLSARGKTVTLHTVEPGEGSKSLDTAAQIFDELTDAELTRKDALVALGGGVVGDLTGFVASTFLRGVPFVQIPTTTLAAVDSSVGGKTAVNTPRGKNLVGTFYPPRAVLVAGAHLLTQGERQHVAGLVEALKMAATCDAELFDDMIKGARALVHFDAKAVLELIGRAVTIKAGVVGRDEEERGERAILNYGHTIGHAIETGEKFQLLHGEAVALGMLAEAAWADSAGLSNGMEAKLAEALEEIGAPTRWREARVDMAALGVDKKREGDRVKMPVVPKIGSVVMRDVPLATLKEFVERRSE